MADNQDPSKKPGKGYGKRPVWFWIFMYLVIAIVVYGLIYLIFIRGGGGDGGGGGGGGNPGGGLPY